MNTISRRRFLRDTAIATLGAGLGGVATRASVFGQSPAASIGPAAPTGDPGALSDLRARLHGTLMLPGDSGYPAASAPANGRYADILPVAIARCADEADVVTCIAWCNETGIRPVVRGGGHSYAGFSTTDGLLIDLRRLRTLSVDRGRATAVAGGAALNEDFFVALEDGSLFLPGGTCLGVGIGGLTLGGGIGYNTHWAGLTADHLIGSRIALASGEIIEVDESREPDLFWALRGGAGGSFGVNTQFTFRLVEAPVEDVAYYRFEFTGADAAYAVLDAFDELIQSAPPALNAVAMAQATPVGAAGPRAAIDVMTRGQYIGPLDELRDLVAPLLAAGSPADMTLETMSFWDYQRLIASTEPEQHNFGDWSRYSDRRLPESIIGDLVDILVECPARTADANGSIWSLGWVGGDVMNAIGRTDTAYVHRGMSTLMRPTTVWPDSADPSVGDALDAWTREVITILEPHSPDESYQNFPNRAITDWAEQYYAENLDRLIDVKTRFDPGDLFRNPQSIPVRSA
jgi:FAD/FMN-containing dehydrogenase